jgi:hypothetical protein
MGFYRLVVEDLQDGKGIKCSTRFAARNRKNRVNIGRAARNEPPLGGDIRRDPRWL